MVILKKEIYPLPLKFSIQEMIYIIKAVGQFDSEYEIAPEKLAKKLNSYAENNGLDERIWVYEN